MNERYTRRRALGLMGAVTLSTLVGDNTSKHADPPPQPGSFIPTQINTDQIAAPVPDMVKPSIASYEERRTAVLPQIAAGEAEPPKPAVPEYRRSTPFIAEKPVWPNEYMSSLNTGAIKRINTGKPLIALTIDDGFAKNSLQTILNIAISKGITYTDFMKGLQREMYPDFIKKMIESNRVEFGSHTQLHRDERNSSQPGRPPTREELIEDISAPERFMNKFGETTLPYQRPPGGAISEWTVEVSGSIGYRSILWSASADYGSTTPLSSLRPGDIVLMHYRDESASQLAGWIDAVRAKGLEPTALSNVFAAEGK